MCVYGGVLVGGGVHMGEGGQHTSHSIPYLAVGRQNFGQVLSRLQSGMLRRNNMSPIQMVTAPLTILYSLTHYKHSSLRV